VGHPAPRSLTHLNCRGAAASPRPVLHPGEMETHMAEVSAAVIEKLKGISTATISTCLYKRGLRKQYVQDVLPVGEPKSTSMVGPAFTLRYIPVREDLNGLEGFRNPEHPQRKAVETCPPGAVLVMDSRKNPRAASAGSILIGRLQ